MTDDAEDLDKLQKHIADRLKTRLSRMTPGKEDQAFLVREIAVALEEATIPFARPVGPQKKAPLP